MKAVRTMYRRDTCLLWVKAVRTRYRRDTRHMHTTSSGSLSFSFLPSSVCMSYIIYLISMADLKIVSFLLLQTLARQDYSREPPA